MAEHPGKVRSMEVEFDHLIYARQREWQNWCGTIDRLKLRDECIAIAAKHREQADQRIADMEAQVAEARDIFLVHRDDTTTEAMVDDWLARTAPKPKENDDNG